MQHRLRLERDREFEKPKFKRVKNPFKLWDGLELSSKSTIKGIGFSVIQICRRVAADDALPAKKLYLETAMLARTDGAMKTVR